MDKTKLTPANENPWYVLMTLYGEQEGEGEWPHEALAVKNRAVWNAWACQALDDDAAADLARQAGVGPAETRGWADMAAKVKDRHRAEMQERNGANFKYPGFPEVSRDIRCLNIQFLNTLALSNCIFTQVARFGYATFSRRAYFLSATFTQRADFSSATFSQNAYFDSAAFTQVTSFNSATFSRDAYFDSATFSPNAHFICATFSQEARFGSATFSQNTHFDSATFTQEADFDSATFSQGANFKSATFHGPARFVKTRFGNPESPKLGLLNLTDTKFEKPASFREAVFLNRYPDFTGTIMPAQTLFPWEPENWPAACDQDPKHGRDSCAVLRHHLGKQGLPEAESFFYRREMGFARRIGSVPARLPYLIYGWLSDYGYSIERPANLLLALWLGGILIYFEGAHLGVFEAAGYSFANMFKFFGLHRTYFDFDMIREWPAWVQFVSGGQTVLAFTLLFFLGLGLRTRFRLR